MASVRLGTSLLSFDLREEDDVDTVRIGNKRDFVKEESVASVDEGLGSRERERERERECVTQVKMHITLGIGRNKTKVRHVQRRCNIFET